MHDKLAYFARVLLPLALLAASGAASAVGLGTLQVRSKLNQPLEARIPLTGLARGEVDGLDVRLGDDAAFERAGLERHHLLTQLRFEAHAVGALHGYIRVRSRDSIREPSLSFVVELSSGAQVLQRRYDVLLSFKD